MTSLNQASHPKTPKKRALWSLLIVALLLASLGVFYALSESSEATAEKEPAPKEKESSDNSFVVLQGNLHAPGRVFIPRDGRLALRTALTVAGGFKKMPDTRKVRLDRKGKSRVVNLDDPEERDSIVYLKPGDTVVVPEGAF